ncbi:oligomeric golgi complex component, COG2-domain-containing protein [Xylariaceae sp. FL1019]|nr:oligomeric golgi complex component, COG2-domain-containing protein [Xylariaceae sp. FL1019]
MASASTAATLPHRSNPNHTFSLSSVSSSASDSDSDTPLPFPAALPRSDFLAPSFDAARYLSSLPERHQTLEDLRSDLRERSAAIGAELLELVNANYASFLGLGDELKGGEDRVEDCRVGLLGFRRGVEEIRHKTRERRDEVARLNSELRGARSEIEVGRKMIELDDRVSSLEDGLAVGSIEEDSEEEVDEDEEKLERMVKEFGAIEDLAEQVGRDTAFVRRMEERVARCRNTLLLDLNAALKEARKGGGERLKVLRLMWLYAEMEAQVEAVDALKRF